MKNFLVFAALCGVLAVAMALGMQRGAAGVTVARKDVGDGIPSIGRIQVLNGCGVSGAANKVADYLRLQGFDVKNKGNAPTANYTFTLVVSRKKDMSIAQQVASALCTDKLVLLRGSDETYDATVFVGPDFAQRTAGK